MALQATPTQHLFGLCPVDFRSLGVDCNHQDVDPTVVPQGHAAGASRERDMERLACQRMEVLSVEAGRFAHSVLGVLRLAAGIIRTGPSKRGSSPAALTAIIHWKGETWPSSFM
jgi:hypothetical protein